MKSLRLKKLNSGYFYVGNEVKMYHSPLPYNASTIDLQLALEALPTVGNVLVTRKESIESIDFSITYLTDTHPVAPLKIRSFDENFEFVEDLFCVCEKGSDSCISGYLSVGCGHVMSREGSITPDATIVIDETDLFITSYSEYQFKIRGLVQSSENLSGYRARIYAGNRHGFGSPCSTDPLKPMGVPDPPAFIEVRREAGSSSSINIHFSTVSFPNNRAAQVNGYIIEWASKDFFDEDVWHNMTVPLTSYSPRLPSYQNINDEFLQATITNQIPGLKCFIRLYSKNEMGIGPPSKIFEIIPGDIPDPMDKYSVPTLVLLENDGSPLSIAKASSSLKLSWNKPLETNGFDIDYYMIEYWTAEGVNEIKELRLLASNDVAGSFTLSYGSEYTDSLSVDITAFDLQRAIESLPSIRSVFVERSGTNPNLVWTVTFLSDVPSAWGKDLKLNEKTEILEVGDGVSGQMEIITVQNGSLPIGYTRFDVLPDLSDQNHFTRIVTGLSAGQHYYFQISSSNALGFSKPSAAYPRHFGPRKQIPSPPLDVKLALHSKSSLLVYFSNPFSNGGSEITKFKIEWDKSINFNSTSGAPYGFHIMPVEDKSRGCKPCSYVISNLLQGQEYFVRVYAYNMIGYSAKAALSKPQSEKPKTQAAPPNKIFVKPYSKTSIIVSFNASEETGGGVISKYKVEWSKIGFHHFEHFKSVDLSKSLLYAKKGVQSITLLFGKNDVRGSFYISYEGHFILVDVSVSAEGMRDALESLPSIGSVAVNELRNLDSHVWLVTFLSQNGKNSWFGNLPLMEISIDPIGSNMEFVSDTSGLVGSVSGTNPRLLVQHVVKAFNGFEQQVVETYCSSSSSNIHGHFTLAFGTI